MNQNAQFVRRGETKIGVLGMGHVGLPTALGLAELGWDVVGADIDRERIALLKNGQCPFYEPGLEEVLQKHLGSSRVSFSDDVAEVIRSVSVLFLCVWTSQRQNGQADLTNIEELARSIAANLNGYKLVIEKSTVPAGTGQFMKKTIERYVRAGRKTRSNGHGKQAASPEVSATDVAEPILFDVASNPEFLQEGRALETMLRPDRVICGTDSELAEQILREIYRPYECPVIVTDLNTSELIKHAANAFLATKISFINMLSDLCESVAADVTDVARGIGLDPRIGRGFLNAGIGFGGYCLPKDLKALVHLAGEHGVNLALLKEVERINRERIDIFLKKVGEAVWIVKGKTIAILGAAFKADTDDIREAPSVPIVEALRREGAILRIYDPKAMPNFQKLFPEQEGRLTYCQSAYEAARGAHALLLLTEWEQFRKLDLKLLQEEMDVPVIVDGRNFFNPDLVRQAGFEYHCMGRAGVKVSGLPAAKEAHSAHDATGNIGDWRSWISPFPTKRPVQG